MKSVLILFSSFFFTGCLTGNFPETRCLNAGNEVQSMKIEHTDIKGETISSKTKIICKKV